MVRAKQETAMAMALFQSDGFPVDHWHTVANTKIGDAYFARAETALSALAKNKITLRES